MADKFVTVGTFWNVMEANLARNRLEAAGIRCLMDGTAVVETDWAVANAIGGIRLQVPPAEAEAATALLKAEEGTLEPGWEDLAEDEEGEEDAAQPAGEEAEVPDGELTQREKDAARALKGSLFGLIFPPLLFYSLWLTIKVIVSEERLSREKARAAWWAGWITVLMILAYYKFFQWSWSGEGWVDAADAWW